MRVAVIGSGPSGVAATSVLLRHQIQVDMFDGGESLEPSSRTTAQSIAAKLTEGKQPDREQLDLLRFGPDRRAPIALLYYAISAALFRSLHPRQLEKRILGSDFAFRGTDAAIPIENAWLPRSLATGGLSNVWGAACYPLRSEDYNDWPITESDLAPWYSHAEFLAGLTGEADSLADIYPIYSGQKPIQPDSRFDPQSPIESLLIHWRNNHATLMQHGLSAGRSRLAVLPPTTGGQGCLRCGLCLYGCPVDAIWHADKVLPDFSSNTCFQHKAGNFVRRLHRDGHGLWLHCGRLGDAETTHGPYDSVLLAAGPLSSLRIAIDTMGLSEHHCRLVENDTFVVPFRLTRQFYTSAMAPVQFAMSQAVVALEAGLIGTRAAHLQYYRVTEPILGTIGRILAKLPLNIGHAIFSHLRNHLIALAYLHSDDSKKISVHADGMMDCITRLKVQVDNQDYRATLHRLATLFNSVQNITGLKMLSSWSRFGPPGFSGHIGGTLPLSRSPSLLQCHSDGRLEGIPGVYVVDMSVFPTMPAQNPTLTAMANAMRCADGIVRSAKTEISL